MIGAGKSVMTPLLRYLVILTTVIVLFMSVHVAAAYMPPPVPYPIDTEGDGDDFYNYLNRQRRQQPAGYVEERVPAMPSGSPTHPIVSAPWDTHTIDRETSFRLRLATWVSLARVIRGF